MGDLGLDPADKMDKDVRGVLQSLRSVVHADLAHDHGKHPYQLQS